MILLDPLSLDRPIRLLASQLKMPECQNEKMAGKWCFHLSVFVNALEQPFVWWVQDDGQYTKENLASGLATLAEKICPEIFGGVNGVEAGIHPENN